MQVGDLPKDANQKVARWILAKFRQEAAGSGHLVECSEASVIHFDGGDGYYGCETGCEYLRLEARVVCPHGEQRDYHYGDFGDMSDIIEDLDAR